jgi:hypothetical protein
MLVMTYITITLQEQDTNTKTMLAAKILCERIIGYGKFGLTTKRYSTAGMPLLQGRLDFEKEGRVR